MKRSSFLAAAAALPGLPFVFSDHPTAAETAMLMEAMAVKPGQPGYQSLHPDAQTDFTSADYYFLGNGKVCVALQHMVRPPRLGCHHSDSCSGTLLSLHVSGALTCSTPSGVCVAVWRRLW